MADRRKYFCDDDSATMVRVPGSFEASGFHRESTGDDVKVKLEPGIDVSATEGSAQTQDRTRSPDRQSFGRGSYDSKLKEEDLAMDLEEKPQTPPQVPSGTTADRSAKSDLPPDEYPMTKVNKYSFVESSPDAKTKKTAKTKKAVKKTAPQAKAKMKAPGSGGEDRTDAEDRKLSKTRSKKGEDRKKSKIGGQKVKHEELAQIGTPKIASADEMWERVEWECHWSRLKEFLRTNPVFKILQPKLIGTLQAPRSLPIRVSTQIDSIRMIIQLLKEAGFVPGVFEAADLLQCSQEQLWDAAEAFVDHLIPFFEDTEIAERKIAASPDGSRDPPSGLSRYASASSEIGSDDSISFRRMSLGPSGASFLRDRCERVQIDQVECKPEPTNNGGVGYPRSPTYAGIF